MESIANTEIIKLCTACGEFKLALDFHARATQCKSCRRFLMKKYYLENHDACSAYSKNRVNNINTDIFNLLGKTCSECGESEQEFLTVDHVNNDRKKERSYNSLVWKTDILNGFKDLSKYKILCRNCNEAKQRKNPIQLLKEQSPVGEKKVCTSCKRDLDLSSFYKRDEKTRKNACSFCMRQESFSLIKKCYDFLGGLCRCCGESDPYKLNIDHINNDGNTHRKNGGRTGIFICKKILCGELDTSNFQILCANCNYSKMRHEGICLHFSSSLKVAS